MSRSNNHRTTRGNANALVRAIMEQKGRAEVAGAQSMHAHVVLAQTTRKVHDLWVELAQQRHKYKRILSLPKQGEAVAIKISKKASYETEWQFLQASMNELLNHMRLYTAPCQKINNISFCSKQYVPRLFFGGYNSNNKTFYIVMSQVRGTPIEYLESQNLQQLTAAQYMNIEKAMISFWLNGVTHNDFHSNNIFLDPDKVKITVIDFGNSVYYPRQIPKLRDHIRDLLRSRHWSQQSIVRATPTNYISTNHNLKLMKLIMKNGAYRISEEMELGSYYGLLSPPERRRLNALLNRSRLHR